MIIIIFYFISSTCFPPITEFCSAELLGYKFIVPCNVEELLSHEYGPNGWKSPEPNDYNFINAEWGNGEARSINELPYMYRYYYKNGTINLSRTLESINKLYFPLTSKNLTEIAKDEKEYI